ncbi:hypothetical protein BJ322DRAFT_1167867 [Thelephora terrestris]|uniref:Ubiquitin-like protease family profile domain-containing protein n=1 Tax=Thelephora terrestris TaxID=56493 RepID=A0A9P6L291_9AGAM|nr:hypothetical protein BJ322DRAFT_1167867 [Thelephora terrestris]
MDEPIEIDADPQNGLDALLQAVFSNETEVPGKILCHIPSASISISSLLKNSLPTLLNPSTVNLQPAESCTTKLPTCWDVDKLLKALIPPRRWLSDLEITLKKKWPGVTSVQHPTISSLYFPLWVGNFWWALVEAVEQKDEWSKAARWISHQRQDAKIYEAKDLMERVPWGTKIWALTGADSLSFVGVLAQLLSTEWLRERHLDTLASYFNFYVSKDKKVAGECWIGDVYLSVCVKRVYRASKAVIHADRDLSSYGEKIAPHGYKRLLFPANLNNNHWIVFSVDLVKNQFCYGDSFGDRNPNAELQQIRRGLTNWLSVVFGVSFADLGNALPIGQQEDGHSCGICVINAIEHAIFNVPLFTDENRYRLRVQYFVEAVKYLLENVGISVMISPAPASNSDAEPTNPGTQRTGEAIELMAGDEEGRGESEDDIVVRGQNEEGDDADPHDFAVEQVAGEASPRSPTLSRWLSDAVCPPSSDFEVEMTDADDQVVGGDVGAGLDMSGTAGVDRLKQSRKKVEERDDGGGTERKLVRKQKKRETESDDESGDDGALSRSAEASRKLKEDLRSGTFAVDEGKRKRFEGKCRAVDGHAMFRYKKSWQVRHSKCSKWVKMREPYDMVRFGDHVKGCKRTGEKFRDGAIDSFFKPRDAKETGTMRMAQPSVRMQIVTGAHAKLTETLIKQSSPSFSFVSKERPCFGLRKAQDERIETYISRVTSEGAGSHSETYLTETYFGKGTQYRELDADSKYSVAAAQVHSEKWKISHRLGAVFSANCQRSIVVTDEVQSLVCDQCLGLFRLNAFKKALRTKPPPLEKLKFTPHRHRTAATSLGMNLAKIEGVSDLLEKDSKHSVWVQFGIGVINGKFQDNKVFLGLIEAMVGKSDQQERKVGNQNFRYTKEVVDFSQLIMTISPQSCNFRRFAIYSDDRILRSQSHKFPRTICSECFARARDYVDSVEYAGPVALGCDDTKLHPSLQVYWDTALETHVLVGTTSAEVIKVGNPEELEQLLLEYKDQVATKTDNVLSKLRLWCIVIPLIGIPSMIVAAEAIPNDLSASDSYTKSLAVIEGLMSHGVNLVSYATDGVQVERNVQDLLASKAIRTISYKVPDPEGTVHTISLPIFGDSPVVMVQDSKHALKTMRNNLFSGARALVLGNHLAMYSYARDLAFTEIHGHPLYHRDVEKMDRQDDNAATRLFSAATLDFVRENHPDRLGFAVYLFVMGEVVDAYQSRSIGHHERLRMVFRCRYFTRLWRRFLQAGKYSRMKYYISREADDILEKLVDGLLGLIYVYRDQFQGRYPLLPWLHSTEICEHVFAECRKLIKDFTHLNFLFMNVRLQTLLRASLALARGTDPKSRANGYSHAYLDPETARVESLAVFPNDEEIEIMAGQAWDEAASLLSLVGIESGDIESTESESRGSNDAVPNVANSTREQGFPEESDHGVEGSHNEDSDAAQLQRFIGLQATEDWGKVDESSRDKMHVLTCAAMALEMGDMHALTESNTEADERILWRADAAAIRDAQSTVTDTAARGCGSGTGLERSARWRSAPGAMNSSEVSELKGNSANAEVAAKDRVKAVSNLNRHRLSHPVLNALLA